MKKPQTAGAIHINTSLDGYDRGMKVYSGRNLIVFSLVLLVSAAIRFVGIDGKQLWLDEIIQILRSSPESIGEILKT